MGLGKRAPMTSPTATSRNLLLLVAVALAARAITFGNPIVFVDEEFYLTAAHAVCNGAVPYVDVWDRKPVGLFLLYLPAGCAGARAGVWIYQAIALGAVVGTALLIVRLARRAGWTAGAMPAAALYILWLNFADGQGGQAPVFYNPLVAGAALLTVGAARQGGSRRRWFGLGAMLLVGTAMQIKYAAVFEGVFFGLWLLWAERRAAGWTAALLLGLALIAAALLPTAAAAGAYATTGHLPAFLYANFVSILQRSADPLPEQLTNLETSAAILLPLLIVAAGGLLGRDGSTEQRFLRGWAMAAIGGFVVFGSWFNHYTLPVIVPLAVCAAGSIARQGWSGRATAWVLGIAFVAGQGVLLSERHIRGSPAQFRRIVAAVGHRPGALYVYSGSSLYYGFSERPVLTRYLFPSHLQTARENGAVGVSQRAETLHILRQRPAVVVVQSLDGGERPDLHVGVVGWLDAHGYGVAARLPLGNKHVDVYRASPAIGERSASGCAAVTA